MKRILLILIALCFSVQVFASEVTEFLESICEKNCNTTIKIVSKTEHTDNYNQKIGDVTFPYIAYGYGYMKKKKCKKQTISYICLLNENCKPIWGYIIPR